MARVRALRAQVEGEDLLLVEVRAPEVPVQPRRLDLALVIDRSGSMRGNRLKAAREAARALAQATHSAESQLGLVAFNDEVLSAGGWVLPSEVAPLLGELEAEGGTNLYGGWEAGAQLLDAEPRSSLRAVLLLTDGLANQGVVEPPVILEGVARMAQKGVFTSTLGIGLGYNEALLSAMAEVGGGTHLYISDGQEGELGPQLLRELRFLQGAALDGVHLRLWGALAQPYLGIWEGREGRVGPMASGETRTLLLQLQAPGESISLEAEVLLPKGREVHHVAVGEASSEGPDYEWVLLERRVAEVRQLYRELPGVQDEEQAGLLRLRASLARIFLEDASDARAALLVQQLKRLEENLEQLAHRFDEHLSLNVAKAFMSEADGLNSTHRKRPN